MPWVLLVSQIKCRGSDAPSNPLSRFEKVQVLACAKSTGKPLGKRHLVYIEIALLGKFVQPHAPQHLNVAVQDLCLGTFLQ